MVEEIALPANSKLPRCVPFPREHDLCESWPFGRADQQVHMVRHEDANVYPPLHQCLPIHGTLEHLTTHVGEAQLVDVAGHRANRDEVGGTIGNP